MINAKYKKKSAELVKQAKKKGLVTKYSDFTRTKKSKEYALTEEESNYYTSKKGLTAFLQKKAVSLNS